jgi:hypothetical protein
VAATTVLFHEAEGWQGSQEAVQGLQGKCVLFVATAAAAVAAASTRCRWLGKVLREESKHLRT